MSTTSGLSTSSIVSSSIADSLAPPASPSKSHFSLTDSSMAGFKLFLLVLMALQNSSTVLVGRYTRSSVAKEDLYSVNHLILTTEIGKLVLACILEHFGTHGQLHKSLKENVMDRPLDALKILVPALLYLVQNSLLYIALGNLSAPLFQVTYQGKLVTTALVSVFMLQRQYSLKQWVCLVVLSLGVAIVVLGETKPEAVAVGKPAQSLALGLGAVTISCLSSALAGVYFEKVLKKTDGPNVSLWMRNIQLAFFSVVIAVFQALGQGGDVTEPKSYFHGFTPWVWVLVALQAGGGMLVAAVIKYADNVLKGLATGVSVVLATACSAVMFSTPISGQFSLGGSLILASVYLFSNNLPGMSTTKNPSNNDKLEMKPLVLPK